MTREEKFMMEAIALSHKGIENNEGGSFGRIVVKITLLFAGEIILKFPL